MDITCVADTRSTLGEGPVWDNTRKLLWWVDIHGHLVHAFDPASGENKSWDIGERVSFACPRRGKSELLLTTESGVHSFDPETGAREEIHIVEPDLPGNRFNDAVTDRQGRLWAGTMRDDGKREPVGSFYRIDEDMSLTHMMDGFYVTNGLAFSPDGTKMYFAESHKDVRTIWVCDYDAATGTPGERRVFVDTHGMPGRPDGGTVDAEGYYWMAAVDGWQIMRFAPDGSTDRVIDLPIERPTKPLFGGAGLDTLFVTSLSLGLDPDRPQPQAGSLFAITGLGVSGIADTPFAG